MKEAAPLGTASFIVIQEKNLDQVAYQSWGQA
ncbi:hypothetical protein CLV24_114110 [Pontibacter ummariensis]|uniref:Uncharacterized protein n=1 Tax=Pontibacter ummariensis TaxID=1610492 RepID=A0A239HQB6_9BACT|nr:hypothetical protein CLV24_114110 [Pontibacter ummariensis]SNS83522.1 hypothetical protein SAMN06296052_114110 [Pontibacter ummariensis]